ncbi:dienelactone hydrolase family protein [Lichenihabitans sp. Uapishka_5]|uniref:dienelactone hydrolase family protein n=1 Tax=Lichenihabitans sp. Uapishka_5 TaxID=3037302 RepID=UPI0029E813B5|nr:dienelactone hydrolase family protein [Lichenihabitans sp. Uapishka_5]MDX7953166.1 dienelactone hydrolase family protein [Lichenihabitans sp. Uapishka_5]
MGTTIALTASDGVSIQAYRAEPTGTPRGGIVVLQEIFGVNPHIRSVADRYAEQGYLAIAPALFDRVTPGLELGYDQDGMTTGIATQKQTVPADTLKDVAAAVALAASAGKVGIVGYCWGGTLAYAAACQLDGVAAAVGYYGGGIASMLDKKPRVPVMLHFGQHDDHIPMTSVAAIRAALPDVPVYDYPAGHGFNCDARGSYDKASADQALSRTLPFFKKYVG